MTTWLDPDFGEAITSAGLIAIGDVVESDPRVARVRLTRVFAGSESAGAIVTVKRAPVVGRGHEEDTLPIESLLFVVRSAADAYEAFTDTYWWFGISDGDRVHIPIRDPFTRLYVKHDDLAGLVTCMRDATAPRDALLDRLATRLAETPVAATQPIEVNDQIIALEALSQLGSERFANLAIPLLSSPHVQVRWSAVRALGTCGGHAAKGALLELLDREARVPVQGALAEALFSLATPGDRPAIERALPRMSPESMLYSRNIMNPVMNTMPAPRATLAAVLKKLDSAPGAVHASTTQTQISADGEWYWDGKAWVSTRSADGKWRWDGRAWVPS